MPAIISVTDAADPRLEAYKNIKDRDLTGRGSFFMAEGKVVLERLFSSELCNTISVLTTVLRLQTLDISSLGTEVPIFLVEQELMDLVAGFPIHRGYLALGEFKRTLKLSDVLAGKRAVRVLGLSEIANMDNMGGLMRNAAAFGIDAVLLDPTCCDPLYRKSIRVSVGGVLQVPHFWLDQREDLISVLERYNIKPYALSPSGQYRLDEIEPDARSALIFGAEGPGLSQDIMSQCTSVRIEMFAGFDSLNVATTSGIVLYHMRPRTGFEL